MHPRSPLVAGLVGLVLLVIVGCSTTGTGGVEGGSEGRSGNPSIRTNPGTGPCPVASIRVGVSVDQWGDIVGRLAGACAEVTTIIQGSSADPHDYEPTPADIAALSAATLVVVNGVGYDRWAEKAVETMSPKPAVVNGGVVTGRQEGENPHLWYGPEFVDQIAHAVTAQLSALAPGASDYFERQAAAFATELQPYRDEIAAVATVARGRSYAATEPVFDDMAAAVGLQDRTPAGYRHAASNESDPAPGDIDAFQQVLISGQVDVLIVNTQTEGAIPGLVRNTATSAAVPVVEVTETLAPGATSFVEWQVSQLEALREALG